MSDEMIDKAAGKTELKITRTGIPFWAFVPVFFVASFLMGMNFGRTSADKSQADVSASKADIEALKKFKADVENVMPVVAKRMADLETAHNGLVSAVQKVTIGQEAKMTLMEKAMIVQIGKSDWDSAIEKAKKALDGASDAVKTPEKASEPTKEPVKAPTK